MIKIYSKRKMRPKLAIASRIELDIKLTFFNISVNLSRVFSSLKYLLIIIVRKYVTEDDSIKSNAKSEADLYCFIPWKNRENIRIKLYMNKNFFSIFMVL